VILGFLGSDEWIKVALKQCYLETLFQGPIKVLKEHRAEVVHGSFYLWISYLNFSEVS